MFTQKKGSALLNKFKQMQGSPVSLARGATVGVFIGIAPLMPLKSILILLITLATGSSTVAALLVGTLICNPITYLPLYYLAWLVGDFLFPGRASWPVLQAALAQLQHLSLTKAVSLAAQIGVDVGVVLLAGGCLIALPPALLSYPLALRFFLALERKRHQKHLLNRIVEEPNS